MPCTTSVRSYSCGDRVVASDPVTGRTEPHPVTRVIRGVGLKYLVAVTVDIDGATGEQTGAIEATEGHPFWVDNKGRWINAGELQPGESLRTPDGRCVVVTGVRTWTEVREVYNLTVEGIHTYYVFAGTHAS